MKAILRYTAGFCIVILILLGIVWQHTEFTNMEYEENRLKQKLRCVTNRGRELRIEVVRLKAPTRIERLAQKMGYIYPQPDKTIILPEIVLSRQDSNQKRQDWWGMILNLANAGESKDQLPVTDYQILEEETE